MGGVLCWLVEVGEDDVERVVVRDKVDDCRGNGHHQTQEKSEPPPGWEWNGSGMGVEWEWNGSGMGVEWE